MNVLTLFTMAIVASGTYTSARDAITWLNRLGSTARLAGFAVLGLLAIMVIIVLAHNRDRYFVLGFVLGGLATPIVISVLGRRTVAVKAQPGRPSNCEFGVPSASSDAGWRMVRARPVA